MPSGEGPLRSALFDAEEDARTIDMQFTRNQTQIGWSDSTVDEQLSTLLLRFHRVT